MTNPLDWVACLNLAGPLPTSELKMDRLPSPARELWEEFAAAYAGHPGGCLVRLAAATAVYGAQKSGQPNPRKLLDDDYLRPLVASDPGLPAYLWHVCTAQEWYVSNVPRSLRLGGYIADHYGLDPGKRYDGPQMPGYRTAYEAWLALFRAILEANECPLCAGERA